jgi:hypothetical protein
LAYAALESPTLTSLAAAPSSTSALTTVSPIVRRLSAEALACPSPDLSDAPLSGRAKQLTARPMSARWKGTQDRSLLFKKK